MKKGTTRITPARCATVFVFALFAIGSLLAFGYYFLDLSTSLIFKKEIIEFNKGAMYMLGAGLGSGLLVFFMVYELSGKRVTRAYNKIATRFAFASIGLMFAFPQLVDYFVGVQIRSVGYVFCENKSYRWLHAQNKVYGVNADVCHSTEVNKTIKTQLTNKKTPF